MEKSELTKFGQKPVKNIRLEGTLFQIKTKQNTTPN